MGWSGPPSVHNTGGTRTPSQALLDISGPVGTRTIYRDWSSLTFPTTARTFPDSGLTYLYKRQRFHR